MAGGFTAFATILGGFLSGSAGIIVFFVKDKVEDRREKKEWYSDIIRYTDQITYLSERYESEYCGELVRDTSGRMHTKFQNHIESAPNMVSDDILELLNESSVKLHDISTTRIHSYEGGDNDGETHLQNRHEDVLDEVSELSDGLNEKVQKEKEEIGFW